MCRQLVYGCITRIRKCKNTRLAINSIYIFLLHFFCAFHKQGEGVIVTSCIMETVKRSMHSYIRTDGAVAEYANLRQAEGKL
jgi:hypothetical protein